MTLKMLLIVSAASSMVCAAAHAAIIVPGDADIFAAGLATAPNSTGGGGVLPPSYSVIAGQTLDISATGTVNCCDTASTGSTGPDGFATNPFGSGTSITNSTGSNVSGFSASGAFPLVATFGNASGAIGDVFKVGSSDLGVLVPTGATEIFFGLPDASGFNGPSGYYGDNSGAFFVTISAVPEPGVWAMMIMGLGLMGSALRLGHKRGATALAA
jgi:hypothetical protein